MKRLDSSNSFYYTFLICLCLVSIPIKNFAYIVPLVYLLLQMWAGNQRLTIRTAMLSGVVLTLSAVSLLWDASHGQQVNVPGMLLALLTFLPLLILLCETFDRRIDDALFRRLLTLCGWYVIAQSSVGIVQFVASANPDAVAGTFGLFDFLNERITIAHVYFTFTMYCMILFLSCDLKRPLSLAAIGMGLLTTTMAHSAHQEAQLIQQDELEKSAAKGRVSKAMEKAKKALKSGGKATMRYGRKGGKVVARAAKKHPFLAAGGAGLAGAGAGYGLGKKSADVEVESAIEEAAEERALEMLQEAGYDIEEKAAE